MPFVLPAGSPSVAEGDALEDLFQASLAGITGIAPELVRPRWQMEPPNVPDFSETWLAFGVTEMPADKYAHLRQVDEFTTELQESQDLVVLCSFYGPQAQAMASRLRDGLQIQDNRAALAAQNIKFVEVSRAVQVPALMKQTWVKRVDETVRFRRWVLRRYAVGAIASADMGLDNEHYITPIEVTPPTP